MPHPHFHPEHLSVFPHPYQNTNGHFHIHPECPIIVNNFMSCHRFNLIHCLKLSHFPDIQLIVYTTVHFWHISPFRLHSPYLRLELSDNSRCHSSDPFPELFHFHAQFTHEGRPELPGRPFPAFCFKLSVLPAQFA